MFIETHHQEYMKLKTNTISNTHLHSALGYLPQMNCSCVWAADFHTVGSFVFGTCLLACDSTFAPYLSVRSTEKSSFKQWTLRSFDLHSERKQNLCIYSTYICSSLVFWVRGAQRVIGCHCCKYEHKPQPCNCLVPSCVRWPFWQPGACFF